MSAERFGGGHVGDLHQILVAGIPGIRTRRFKRTAINEISAWRIGLHSKGHDGEPCNWECLELEEGETVLEYHRRHAEDLFCDFGHIIPDGYRFTFGETEDTLEVAIYEVEVTSLLSEEKLRRYADLWFAFDSQWEGWRVRLFTVDRCGHEKEVDLCDWWYRFLKFDNQQTEEQNQAARRFLRHDPPEGE